MSVGSLINGGSSGVRATCLAPAKGDDPGSPDLCNEVVRLVDGLESDGAVERKPGKEGRTVALFLTRAGKLAHAQLLERRRRAIDGLLDALSATERTELTRLVEKLLTAMTTGRESANSFVGF